MLFRSMWAYLTAHDLFSRCPLWNVNIPIGTTGEFRITRQGGPYYSDDFGPLENDMYTPLGKPVWVTRNDEKLDTDAVLHYRHISVTPLTIDRTARDVFETLK